MGRIPLFGGQKITTKYMYDARNFILNTSFSTMYVHVCIACSLHTVYMYTCKCS